MFTVMKSIIILKNQALCFCGCLRRVAHKLKKWVHEMKACQNLHTSQFSFYFHMKPNLLSYAIYITKDYITKDYITRVYLKNVHTYKIKNN